jgi:hypothetical protein
MPYSEIATALRAASRFRILLVLSLAAAARAGTLPPPVTLAECVDSTVTDDPSSCSVSGRDAFASGSLTLFPFVSLTAQDFSGPANDLFIPGAGVFVSVKYSFQVVGGNPGDIVPILIATSLTSNASSFGAAYGFAETVVSTSFGTISEVVCTNDTCGTTNTSFFGTFGTRAMSGESGDTIQLEIEAQSGDSPLAQSANASADPFIFIDPSFAGAANYSIQVSPGVGNGLAAAGVPEPGTFALLGCALLIVGYLGRSSRE